MSMKVLNSLQEIPRDCRFADCAVSGGTLETYIRTLLRLTQGRLCLRLKAQAVLFPLPCPQGQGSTLSGSQLRQLTSQHPSFYAPELVMNYLTYKEGDRLSLLLYDTEETLRKKKLLCQQLEVPYLLLE